MLVPFARVIEQSNFANVFTNLYAFIIEVIFSGF